MSEHGGKKWDRQAATELTALLDDAIGDSSALDVTDEFLTDTAGVEMIFSTFSVIGSGTIKPQISSDLKFPGAIQMHSGSVSGSESGIPSSSSFYQSGQQHMKEFGVGISVPERGLVPFSSIERHGIPGQGRLVLPNNIDSVQLPLPHQEKPGLLDGVERKENDRNFVDHVVHRSTWSYQRSHPRSDTNMRGYVPRLGPGPVSMKTQGLDREYPSRNDAEIRNHHKGLLNRGQCATSLEGCLKNGVAITPFECTASHTNESYNTTPPPLTPYKDWDRDYYKENDEKEDFQEEDDEDTDQDKEKEDDLDEDTDQDEEEEDEPGDELDDDCEPAVDDSLNEGDLLGLCTDISPPPLVNHRSGAVTTAFTLAYSDSDARKQSSLLEDDIEKDHLLEVGPLQSFPRPLHHHVLSQNLHPHHHHPHHKHLPMALSNVAAAEWKHELSLKDDWSANYHSHTHFDDTISRDSSMEQRRVEEELLLGFDAPLRPAFEGQPGHYHFTGERQDYNVAVARASQDVIMDGSDGEEESKTEVEPMSEAHDMLLERKHTALPLSIHKPNHHGLLIGKPFDERDKHEATKVLTHTQKHDNLSMPADGSDAPDRNPDTNVNVGNHQCGYGHIKRNIHIYELNIHDYNNDDNSNFDNPTRRKTFPGEVNGSLLGKDVARRKYLQLPSNDSSVAYEPRKLDNVTHEMVQVLKEHSFKTDKTPNKSSKLLSDCEALAQPANVNSIITELSPLSIIRDAPKGDDVIILGSKAVDKRLEVPGSIDGPNSRMNQVAATQYLTDSNKGSAVRGHRIAQHNSIAHKISIPKESLTILPPSSSNVEGMPQSQNYSYAHCKDGEPVECGCTEDQQLNENICRTGADGPQKDNLRHNWPKGSAVQGYSIAQYSSIAHKINRPKESLTVLPPDSSNAEGPQNYSFAHCQDGEAVKGGFTDDQQLHAHRCGTLSHGPQKYNLRHSWPNNQHFSNLDPISLLDDLMQAGVHPFSTSPHKCQQRQSSIVDDKLFAKARQTAQGQPLPQKICWENSIQAISDGPEQPNGLLADNQSKNGDLAVYEERYNMIVSSCDIVPTQVTSSPDDEEEYKQKHCASAFLRPENTEKDNFSGAPDNVPSQGQNNTHGGRKYSPGFDDVTFVALENIVHAKEIASTSQRVTNSEQDVINHHLDETLFSEFQLNEKNNERCDSKLALRVQSKLKHEEKELLEQERSDAEYALQLEQEVSQTDNMERKQREEKDQEMALKLGGGLQGTTTQKEDLKQQQHDREVARALFEDEINYAKEKKDQELMDAKLAWDLVAKIKKDASMVLRGCDSNPESASEAHNGEVARLMQKREIEAFTSQLQLSGRAMEQELLDQELARTIEYGERMVCEERDEEFAISLLRERTSYLDQIGQIPLDYEGTSNSNDDYGEPVPIPTTLS